MKKLNYGGYYVLFLSLGFLCLQIYLGHFNMNDFKVYYTAAFRLLDQQELYNRVEDGHYIFKYSPTFAFYFLPLSQIPLEWAKLIFWLGSSVLIASVITLISNELIKVTPTKLNSQVLSFFTSLIMTMHILRELDLGQVNLIIICLFFICALLIQKNKVILPAVLFSITFFIKPFVIIIIPFFIVMKNYKILFYFLFFSIVLFFIPSIIVGIDKNLYFQNEWLLAIKSELQIRNNLLNSGNNSIFSIIARYTPLFFILKTELSQTIFKLVSLLIISISYLFFMKKDIKSFMINFMILISWIPLLQYTSDNAFGSYSLFLVAMSIAYFRNWKLIPIFLVFVGLNPLELDRSSTLMNFIFDYSFMGISAFVLLMFQYYIRFNNKANYG